MYAFTHFSSHGSSSFTALISLVPPSNRSSVGVGVQMSVAIGAVEFGLKVDAGLEMSMGVELGFSLIEEEALVRVIGVKLEPSVKVDVE